MPKKFNKNDNPIKKFSQLADEIDYRAFQYKNDFQHICDLHTDNENEKLTIEAVDDEKYIKQSELVYIFVIKGKIFKIGSSTQSIRARIGSYNAGRTQYRIHGTNSTTNYFVLQSFLKIGIKINVYAYFPKKKHYNTFGKKGKSAWPPTKATEKKILEDFKNKHGKLPIGCTQS